ncbi:hypothetical protein [Ethanoligenens harbinense]|uniref:Forkhead box Q1 n=1 Tax=Ethanoligenens harbinense (strain DSM 18485 / JCM 12961 / CGMCC 1.5033 / YUAN-3) TaxID=663278 RepID=E6U9S3_ETHHY|nr:hypothetical protein [Ethanoligenens harbinense]ADU26189.1 forkhead box Q1 [Ethanoligenens harbinense YUAN-3]AVQ95326.1 hypothetical protein CXQ68_03175 [Ethanoligenens harbinense YUAN-3]AYF37991.1 hypothetical protein CXP51_03040 [Ethanoligenens harbinense]AYF40737.1 hypothetical protein CN246_03175 [Ethanoligenens harbinense]QCN91570.1 hypothetical protein DRA42_03180 [Ethanoligenens harbinense]
MPIPNINRTFTAGTYGPPGTNGRSPFERASRYQVDGKAFMVEPFFQISGNETIGTILVKLMQADAWRVSPLRHRRDNGTRMWYTVLVNTARLPERRTL